MITATAVLISALITFICIGFICWYIERTEKKISDKFFEILRDEKEKYEDRIWLLENPKVSNDYEFIKEVGHYGYIFPSIYRSWKLKANCPYRHEPPKQKEVPAEMKQRLKELSKKTKKKK